MNYQTNEKFIVSINLYRYLLVAMTVYGIASQPVDLLPALPCPLIRLCFCPACYMLKRINKSCSNNALDRGHHE